MRYLSLILMAAGASSYILHAMGKQSMVMGVFGEHENIAAPAAIGVGVVLFILSLRKKKKDEKK